MLGGKNKQPPRGYTIIEVLIVLAVSGLMFVIAVNFINGKQGKAAFTQGTNEMASQIQSVIEQVTDGQFSDIPLNCSFNGAQTVVNANQAAHGTGTDSNEGINSQCVFLGKLLRFHDGGDENYNILSLAAGRVTTDGANNPITPTLANTHPAVIDDLTLTQSIPQQLLVKSITVTDVGGGTSASAYNFGFAEGLGTVSGDNFQSGAQNISMIYSAANLKDPSSPNDDINGDNLGYAKAATICLSDDTRYAQILVGGSGDNASQLSVRVKVVPTEAACTAS